MRDPCSFAASLLDVWLSTSKVPDPSLLNLRPSAREVPAHSLLDVWLSRERSVLRHAHLRASCPVLTGAFVLLVPLAFYLDPIGACVSPVHPTSCLFRQYLRPHVPFSWPVLFLFSVWIVPYIPTLSTRLSSAGFVWQLSLRWDTVMVNEF